MPSKETIRHEAIRHRNNIDPFSEDPDKVCKSFFYSIQPREIDVIALYWPQGREFDSRPLIEEILTRGIQCALPVIRKDSKELLFARWDESIDLEKGPLGVMQPVNNDRTEWLEPDIVVVPMLAFDRHGHRLGRGGGYYDATLRALRGRKDITAVGVAYAQQAVLFNLPVEDHDEKLDWIITGQDARRFGGEVMFIQAT